jgi:AICAR transformylase/IMP cyclohydrolase PurH
VCASSEILTAAALVNYPISGQRRLLNVDSASSLCGAGRRDNCQRDSASECLIEYAASACVIVKHVEPGDEAAEAQIAELAHAKRRRLKQKGCGVIARARE